MKNLKTLKSPLPKKRIRVLFDFKKVKIRSRKTSARGEKKKKERKISIFRSWRKESENRRGLQKWFCRVCIDWGRGSPRRLAYILAPLFLRPSRPTCASPSPCRSRFPFCTPRPNLQSSFNIPILSPSTLPLLPAPSSLSRCLSIATRTRMNEKERGRRRRFWGGKGEGEGLKRKNREMYMYVYMYIRVEWKWEKRT